MANRDITWPTGIRPQGRGLRIRLYEHGKVAYSETLKGNLDEAHLARAIRRRRELLGVITPSLFSQEIPQVLPTYHPEELNSLYKQMFKSAKKRASIKDREYSITCDQEQLIVKRANGFCELTRISFAEKVDAEWFRNPFAPSLDRIDSSKGYEFENVRVVIYAINSAINEWGLDLYLQIAERAVMAEKFPYHIVNARNDVVNPISD